MPGPVQIRPLLAPIRCSGRRDMFCFSIDERWGVHNGERPWTGWLGSLEDLMRMAAPEKCRCSSLPQIFDPSSSHGR